MGEVALPCGRVLAGAIFTGLGKVEDLLDAGAQQRGGRCPRVPNRGERAEDILHFNLIDRKIPERGKHVLRQRTLNIERSLAAAPAGAMGSEILGHDLSESDAGALRCPRAYWRLATQKLFPQRPRLLACLFQADRVQRTEPKLGAPAGTVELEDPGPTATRHHLEIQPAPIRE